MIISCISGCIFLGQTQHTPVSQPQHRIRAQEIHAERYKWHNATAPAQSHHSDEALRTLSILEELYKKEQALWTYYDAIEQRQSVEEKHVHDRLHLEKNLQQQQQDLSTLNKTIRQLRPQQEQSGIHFSQ
ncbi:MAG: hypothetical protein HRU15_18835 [Planctomycetes bacterium]|nr:hypothetical protein [Planctomycetota bacterium]